MSETLPTIVKPANDETPVMSFPALLRNPGLSARYGHLLPSGESEQQSSSRKRGSGSADRISGKRRVRRSDNARFTSNPHVVQPTSNDYSIQQGSPNSTFPSPLPRYLRNSQTPATSLPQLPDPSSSAAGHFTLALKGVRKELRRSGPRAERLVKDVEDALMAWLETGDVVLFAASGVGAANNPLNGAAFKNDGPIRELDRNVGRLIWSIPEDAFARYIVHCVCRWHNVVSYSKAEGPDDTSPRLTYILRPNPTRRTGADAIAPHLSLDTPPATELDSASSMGFDSSQETEYAWSEERSDYPPSDADADADAGEGSDDVVEIDEPTTSESFGSMTDSIPDMRSSLILPPIDQESTPRPVKTSSSSLPSSSIPPGIGAEEPEPPSMFPTPLPIRALNMLTIKDEVDFASLGALAQGENPNPNPNPNPTPTRTPRPLVQTSTQASRRSRLGPRSSSRHSKSLSSSPSRSPSGLRWRATYSPSISRGNRVGSALPAKLTGRKARKSDGHVQAQETRTLWSFVYD